MNANLTIHDETTGGSILNQLSLRTPLKEITVKELIRLRVFHEVNEFNNKRSELFRGLVRPDNSEVILNGYKLNSRQKIDPEKQYYIAMDAFQRQGFYILVGEEKIEDPEHTISLGPGTQVSFLKVRPLVGG